MAAAGGGYDPDAQAYINAVIAAGGTLSSGDQDAIDTLFVDLKSAGIYDKTIYMYPYTGNVQNSNALEGKNPGSNSITFNTVSGSWTFNANGATPAAQGWATNGVYLNSVMTLNNAALFTYLGTDNLFAGDYCIDFGTADDLGVNGLNSLIGGSSQPDSTSYFYNNDGGATRITVASSSIPDGIGAFLLNRTSSTLFNVWRNGVKLATNTNTNTGSLPSVNPLYMPAPGSSIISYVNKWTIRRHQFDWVGEGLNDTEAGNLFNIVNNFQTALGRNVYFLLDIYPGADTALSLRKLRNSYSGSAIRVRRSSDNTEQDIGFTGENLDTTSLLSFVGAGNGYVTTFYDQSGNSNNFVQSSATSQPQIVSSGSVVTNNGKPSLLFDGTNDYFTNASQRFSQSTMSAFYVTQNLSPYNYGGIITSKQAGIDSSAALDWDGGSGKLESVYYNPYSVLQTTRQDALFIGNTIFAGVGAGNLKVWTNNVSDGTNEIPGVTLSASSVTWMGTYRTNETVLCGKFYLSELINYFSDQSSNRTGINTNLNSYYAAY